MKELKYPGSEIPMGRWFIGIWTGSRGGKETRIIRKVYKHNRIYLESMRGYDPMIWPDKWMPWSRS